MEAYNAALSLVSSSTSPVIRSSANTFLQSWINSSAAFDEFVLMLTYWCTNPLVSPTYNTTTTHSFSSTPPSSNFFSPPPPQQCSSSDEISAREVLCTIFWKKIRREVSNLSSGNITKLTKTVFQSLLSESRTTQQCGEYYTPPNAYAVRLAFILVAIAVRSNLSEVISKCVSSVEGNAGLDAEHPNSSINSNSNSNSNKSATPAISIPNSPSSNSNPAEFISSTLAFKILTLIPEEIENGALEFSEINPLLQTFSFQILTTINIGLNALHSPTAIIYSLDTLENWSLLDGDNTSINLSSIGAIPNMLNVLLGFLTSDNNFNNNGGFTNKHRSMVASKSALAVSSMLDDSTYGVLVAAVKNNGFIKIPFEKSTRDEDHDTSHALALLTLKLAGYNVAIIAEGKIEGSMEIVEMLLIMQQHPHQPIAILALDFWLDLQDVPVFNREPSLGKPLYARLISLFVKRAGYTPGFTDWENEYELDVQEFDEYRRQIVDVIVTSYQILRSEFLSQLLQTLTTNGSEWTVTESVLFMINSASREVCQRIKARGGGLIASDRTSTGTTILQLTQQLCSIGAQNAMNQHPLVLAASSRYLGNFASVLNDCCSNSDIMSVLGYLHDAMGLCEQAAEPASTSVRAIFLNCNSKLTGDEYRNSTIEIFPQLIETAFKSKNVKVVLAIAEGCTRISLNLDNRTMQGLGGVCTPVFGKITDCMNFLENPHNKQNLSTNQSGQLILIMQTLALSLQTLSIIVQYLDSAQSSKQPISELLNAMWPLLQKVANSPYCRQHDDVLNQLLKVHGRCVNSFGDVIEPKIGELINVVVQAYEETHHSCCCEFVGIAVEKFSAKGGGVEESFCQLLSHLCVSTLGYLKKAEGGGIVDNSELCRSFFEMTQRFLLFCPGGLIKCSEFANLFSFAVACLMECNGEKNSTRAALIFLSQIIGRKGTELTRMILENARGDINSCLNVHGEMIVKNCLHAIAGGVGSLQQAFIDLLWATIVEVVSCSGGAENTVAHNWVFAGLNEAGITREMSNEVKGRVMRLLFLVVDGGVNGGNVLGGKKKFTSLLVDFGMLVSKEIKEDCLEAYDVGA